MLHEILKRLFPSRTGERPVICFVDLGLPSGTQWATYDVEESVMEDCTLPTYEQAQELMEYCAFHITEGSDGIQHITAQGPSGQSVSFPMRDYEGTPGASGCCWCAGGPNTDFGYFLLLSKLTITIGVGRRDLQFPYRMVRMLG